MAVIIQLIGAYLVTVTAGITVEAPKNLIYKTGIIGVVSYAINLYLINQTDTSQAMAFFVACFIASLISQVFARRLHAPVTMFYIPTFYLYVPGSAIYQMAYYFINGEISTSSYYLVQTITLAGAIALGVFMSDSFLEIYIEIRKKLKNRVKSQ